MVQAKDTLGFAGIAPPELRLYPIETHIAEKLHAYTLPRSRPNTRVKDFPDLALLAGIRAIDASQLRLALTQTFAFRRTHPLPTAVPEPAASWTGPYAAMAAEAALCWSSLADVSSAVRAFLDPVLKDGFDATWIPAEWTWQPQRLLVRNGPETSNVMPSPMPSAPR